ncbi:UNVERIFIED_CONTAM: hypothetical protein RMT77_011975 [Armadillidium vulgare]
MAVTPEKLFIATLFDELSAIDKLPVSILIYTTRNQKLKFGKAKLLNDGNRFEFSALSSSVPNNLRAKETQH